MSNTDTPISEEEFKLNIRIGKYAVRRLDSYNIAVEEIRVTKEGKNVGAEYSNTIGYYKRLNEALEKVLRLITESKVQNQLSDIIGALKDAEVTLYKALDDKYKDIEEK